MLRSRFQGVIPKMTDIPQTKMGRYLYVTVEVYDRTLGKWITITADGLRCGRIISYDREAALGQARAAILESNPDFDPEDPADADDVECEAMYRAWSEYTIRIRRNHDLFAVLADQGNGENSKGIIPRSGTRGKPFDSSTDYTIFPHSSVSFLTLSELDQFDWNQRINRPVSMPIGEYDDRYSGNRDGRWKGIPEAEWLAADDAARASLIQSDLRILVDHPVYLTRIDEFLGVVAGMRRLPADRNDIRLIMIFTS